jgi:1-acyl-sn-glycerol-3-phosphate acyltransferase
LLTNLGLRIRRLAALAWVAGSGLWRHRDLPAGASRAECAGWLHQSLIRALRAVNVELHIAGQVPRQGLVVSNHLSYLDIVVYSAALPCVFVSKSEVERWPVIGRYARWAGTVFVRRHDRSDAARANVSIDDALRDGVPVVLFPEGTTTDGERVLRFHSTMLQPAVDTAVPIMPCAIRYEVDEGDVSQEVCWWGDMKLLPHLWNLLGKESIRAWVVFGEPGAATGHRKQLSATLHDEVLRLHATLRSHNTDLQTQLR